MYNNFEINIVNILKDMELERKKLSHPFVGSEHLLLSLLKIDKFTILKMHDYGVTYDTFREKLIDVVGECKKNVDFNLYTPLLKRVLNYAVEEAKINRQKVDSALLLGSLIEEGEGVAIRILLSMDVDLDLVYKNLFKSTSKNMTELKFGKNLNETVDMSEKVIGREKEINSIIETLLRKKKNNPLLIGEAGVGKSAIVEEFVRTIKNGYVPRKLKNAVVVNIDMSQIVSGTKYRGEFEEKLTKIIENSEKDENIILFIDEIHTMTNAGGAEGAIGAGDIFKPYLARGNIKVIGATTIDEYEKNIARDKALSRRFENILVSEPTLNETIDILNAVKGEYEKYHNIKVSKKNIIDIVTLADKFIYDKKNPDKSLDFLDSIASFVQIKNDNNKIENKYFRSLCTIKGEKIAAELNEDFDKALELHNQELEYELKLNNLDNKKPLTIKYKDIFKVLETKSNIPILLNREKLKEKLQTSLNKYENKEEYISFIISKLDDLSKIKSINLIGDASEIIDITRETLKNINYVKINCEEYTNTDSLNKLFGTSAGYVGYKDKHIFSSLKTNPFAIIVFDNINDASLTMKKVIKNILKDGFVLDNRMDKINFKNSIIITVNSELQNKSVGFISSIDHSTNSEIQYDKLLVIKENKLINA